MLDIWAHQRKAVSQETCKKIKYDTCCSWTGVLLFSIASVLPLRVEPFYSSVWGTETDLCHQWQHSAPVIVLFQTFLELQMLWMPKCCMHDCHQGLWCVVCGSASGGAARVLWTSGSVTPALQQWHFGTKSVHFKWISVMRRVARKEHFAWILWVGTVDQSVVEVLTW